MVTTEQVQSLLQGRANVRDQDGEKIGTVGQVFVDDQTGQPEWVTAKTGLFGTSESFIPLKDATVAGDEISVPYSKDMVKDAPRIDDSNGHLSEDGEAQLYLYYGLDYSDAKYDSGLPTEDIREDATTAVGHDASGRATDEAMTRSEEQLHVGTESQVSGRVRLRKYVVTENVTQSVPVSHEEVRLEREPITDATRDDALTGQRLSDEEHDVTLHEEKLVVAKETVPVERVRLDKEEITEDVPVTEEVRKEQIEYDDGDQKFQQ